MFTESNMNPRYFIFRDGKKSLLSECMKNLKYRNILIALMLPVRHSSYVSPNIIKSSMYIAIMIHSNLKSAKGGLLSVVNILGPEDLVHLIALQFQKLRYWKKLKIFCVIF